MTSANSINANTTGVVGFSGSSFTGYPVTQHSVLLGGSSNSINSLSVGGSNTLLQGVSSSDPSFTGYPQISGLGIGASPGSTAGLTFDGSNFINLYQAGTWTPNLQINGSSTGITYGTQGGKYLIIGNVVNFYIRFSLTSKGLSVGNLTISNLPFTGSTNAASQSIAIGEFGSFTSAGYTSLSMQIANGSTVGTLYKSGSGLATANITNVDISNTFLIFATGTYILD